MKTTMPQGNEPAMPAVKRIDIRTETPADIAGIRLVEAEAFPTRAEADLVDRLREDGSAVLSLIAVLDRQVIGHAMFPRMQEPRGSLGLGPVAVLSAHRRRGVAAGLIREGLSRAKADAWVAILFSATRPTMAASVSAPSWRPDLARPTRGRI